MGVVWSAAAGAGCGKGERDSVATVAPDSLAAWLDAGVAAVILDVRPDSLYEAGHLPGSIRAYGKGIADLREVLPPDPQDPIVVVGDPEREAAAARLARDADRLGFPRVFRLAGDIPAWRDAGYGLDGSRVFEVPGALR
jgi:rhodanese-related sulfurtransferase